MFNYRSRIQFWPKMTLNKQWIVANGSFRLRYSEIGSINGLIIGRRPEFGGHALWCQCPCSKFYVIRVRVFVTLSRTTWMRLMFGLNTYIHQKYLGMSGFTYIFKYLWCFIDMKLDHKSEVVVKVGSFYASRTRKCKSRK